MMNSSHRNCLSRTALFAGTALLGLASTAAYGQEYVTMWDYGLQGYGDDIPLEADFTQLAGGSEFTLALRTDGSIHVWGSNHWQQITNAPTGPGFVQVAAGPGACLALHSDGSLVTWGDQGSNPPAGNDFTQAAVGYKHAVALRADGSIRAWGSDTHGQVSNAPTTNSFLQVASGLIFCSALRLDGSIESWGNDGHGQVSGTPTGNGFVSIVGGARHALAMRADGSIVAWGSNSDGQVSLTPAGTGFTQVTASGNTSMALRPDGSIAVWGQYDTTSQPPFLPSGSGFTAIEAGGLHTLALSPLNTGTPFCFHGDFFMNICPCQNLTEDATGCPNSAGTGGAKLVGGGNAMTSSDTFQLTVSGLPHNGFGLVIVGSGFHNGGLGFPLGAGLRCVGGQVAYSQVHRNAGGMTHYSDIHGSPFGSASYGIGVRTNYQFWYRDVAGTCAGSRFNFSNAWSTIWR